MKNKVLQILYTLRHQPVISGVTLIGTALTIFLIMVVVMIQQIPVLPFAPESNRPRLLIGCYIHLENLNEDGIRCAGLSFNAAKNFMKTLRVYLISHISSNIRKRKMLKVLQENYLS